MITDALIQQIHDLCVHLYNDGLNKEDWEHYSERPVDELEDLINRLKLQMIN